MVHGIELKYSIESEIYKQCIAQQQFYDSLFLKNKENVLMQASGLLNYVLEEAQEVSGEKKNSDKTIYKLAKSKEHEGLLDERARTTITASADKGPKFLTLNIDTKTMNSLLTSFGSDELSTPASVMLLEFYGEGSSATVKVTYNDENLALSGCDKNMCNVQKFESTLKGLDIIKDVKSYCSGKQQQHLTE